jgi:hypothetical protein
MSIAITRSTVHINHVIGAVVCRVSAHVEDSVNLETGDSIYTCSINEIADLTNDQLLAPKSLTVEEFRGLVRAVQNKHSL